MDWSRQVLYRLTENFDEKQPAMVRIHELPACNGQDT